uniref:EamA domain-containing protein n=1 Tax=candidate division CPR3 bacterium TaxID=2268181 RepID=A0A7C4RAD1_UNCC3
MNAIIFPLLSVITGTTNVLFEKKIFTKHKISRKVFVPVVFSFVFLILSIFVYPFLGGIADGAFQPLFIFLMAVVIISSCFRNMMYYYSFKREGLCEIEPFVSFIPLLTIIIAFFVYPEERSHWSVFILALIAALALVFSHIRKKHIVIDKTMLPIIGVVVLEAIENNITKELLNFYSPVAMYTIRAFFVATILLAFYKPKLSKIKKEDWKNMFLISILWAFSVVFVYYGYQRLGVIYTSLIMMLAPVLITFGSYLLFKDKDFTKRNVIALLVVLGCVAVAQFVG